MCESVYITCVFPPVLSCTKLLDIEHVMAKVWKKEPVKLQTPRAISSCAWQKNVRQISNQILDSIFSALGMEIIKYSL